MPGKHEILRVPATTKDIKRFYRALSRIYSPLEEHCEHGLRRRVLEMLSICEAECVLEIGAGTGCGLAAIARAVGRSGTAHGVDITPEMLAKARGRIAQAGLNSRVRLTEADARCLPYKDRVFDAVYMVSTLELFDTPDIPQVLAEVKRVLNPHGRLGVGSMSRKGHEDSLFVRAYEWLHRKMPQYATCRPIYVDESLRNAGFEILKAEKIRVGGLSPTRLVVATPRPA